MKNILLYILNGAWRIPLLSDRRCARGGRSLYDESYESAALSTLYFSLFFGF
jgi:hypothetical protein